MAQFQKLMRWLRTVTHLRAHPVDPTDQLDVELDISAEVVIDPAAALQQTGQDLVHILDRPGIVESITIDRAFRTGTRTLPRLAFRVALATKQQRFAVRATRHQYQQRSRFRQTAQENGNAAGRKRVWQYG